MKHELFILDLDRYTDQGLVPLSPRSVHTSHGRPQMHGYLITTSDFNTVSLLCCPEKVPKTRAPERPASRPKPGPPVKKPPLRPEWKAPGRAYTPARHKVGHVGTDTNATSHQGSGFTLFMMGIFFKIHILEDKNEYKNRHNNVVISNLLNLECIPSLGVSK